MPSRQLLAPRRYDERLLSIRQEMACANVFVVSEQVWGSTTEEDVAKEKGVHGGGGEWAGVGGGVGVDKSDYSQE